jgi:DNA-binding transcriptional LysR family regulator
MKRPSLDDLETFTAVARARSFRKAAAELGVSGSAISQVIRNLEERLGIRLLNRTTRSVSATEAGEQLLRSLQPALAEIAGAIEGIDAFRQKPAGSVRINAPAPAVEFMLAPLVEPFLKAYPDVNLELISDATSVDIVEERFDAGVRFGEELALDMVAVPLGPPLRYVVVGAPGYLEMRGTPCDPAELLNHQCLRQRFPSGRIFAWEFEKAGRAVTIAPQGRLTVSDARHLVRAAIAGLGLVRVLDDHVREPLADGQLAQVLGDWCPRIPSWFLYYPSRRQPPPAMRAFLDFLASRRSPPARAASG